MQRTCIACGSHLLKPFYNPGPQPLAALNLPKSKSDAEIALRYPMNFHVCLKCGHVFNVDFDVARIPYEEDSNLMYNSGSTWDTHLDNIAFLLQKAYSSWGKTIVDIGAGDGLLLDRINQASLDEGIGTRCVAFEPGIESESCRLAGLETYPDYFIPARDMARIKPDILICRHVIEHMENPREFVTELAYYALQANSPPVFLAEVPCIEKALKQGRVSDFLYEHVSNFTVRSFLALFESCGWTTHDFFMAYNQEVVVWVGRPDPRSFMVQPKELEADSIRDTINYLLASRDSVAFWGGTGKGAAFLNAYGITGGRVVDSDFRKAGRYVPGTGQLIEHSGSLLVHPVDTVIVTTRWRAADIYAEIKRDYPSVKEILIVDGDIVREYTEEDYEQETPKEIEGA